MKLNIQKISHGATNEHIICYGEQTNGNERQTKQFTKDIVKYFESKNFKNIEEGTFKNKQNSKPFVDGLRFEWDGFEWIQNDELYETNKIHNL